MRVEHKIYTLEIVTIDTPLESCELSVYTRVLQANLFRLFSVKEKSKGRR